ncbi:hypothetical protein Y032_0072g677 [Ancylostoma ceylanicum]|uniref:Rad21/Rec8-like protein C-terminal eukaryotic domain-containing protein n=1 Tax=Ancylostoma ceylanicum TaxID=53326 RepID=A0A016TVP1_9BILA|nr:hypothetical protein Y032_0072g677 [Ancylostoma ceylanicum]
MTTLHTSEETQISFNYLTKGDSREAATQMFLSLLQLSGSQKVNFAQHEAYGDISIFAGPSVAQTLIKCNRRQFFGLITSRSSNCVIKVASVSNLPCPANVDQYD